jgi:hypothetical protein
MQRQWSAPQDYDKSLYPTSETPRSRYDITVRDDKCKTIPIIFTIDSFYRNYAVAGQMAGSPVYSQTANARHNYTAPLPSVFRDVVSIELIKAVIPQSETPHNDKGRYLILSVNGYSRALGNSTALAGSFCNIYAGEGTYAYTRGNNDPDAAYTYFFTEPTSLSKLSISLTYPNGDAPQWHTAGDGLTSDAKLEHVLTFEIRSLNQGKMLVC